MKKKKKKMACDLKLQTQKIKKKSYAVGQSFYLPQKKKKKIFPVIENKKIFIILLSVIF